MVSIPKTLVETSNVAAGAAGRRAFLVFEEQLRLPHHRGGRTASGWAPSPAGISSLEFDITSALATGGQTRS